MKNDGRRMRKSRWQDDIVMNSWRSQTVSDEVSEARPAPRGFPTMTGSMGRPSQSRGRHEPDSIVAICLGSDRYWQIGTGIAVGSVMSVV